MDEEIQNLYIQVICALMSTQMLIPGITCYKNAKFVTKFLVWIRNERKFPMDRLLEICKTAVRNESLAPKLSTH